MSTLAHSWLHGPVKSALNLIEVGYVWIEIILCTDPKGSNPFLLVRNEFRRRIASVRAFIRRKLDEANESWLKKEPTPVDREFSEQLDSIESSQEMMDMFFERLERVLTVDGPELGGGILDWQARRGDIVPIVLAIWDIAGILWALFDEYFADMYFSCRVQGTDAPILYQSVQELAACLTRIHSDVAIEDDDWVSINNMPIDCLILFVRYLIKPRVGASDDAFSLLTIPGNSIVRKIRLDINGEQRQIDDTDVQRLLEQLEQNGLLDVDGFYHQVESFDYENQLRRAVGELQGSTVPIALTPLILAEYNHVVAERDAHHDVDEIDYWSLWLADSFDLSLPNVLPHFAAYKTLCAAILGCPLPIIKWISWFDKIIGIDTAHPNPEFIKKYGSSSDLEDFFRTVNSHWIRASRQLRASCDDCPINIGDIQVNEQLIHINESTASTHQAFRELVEQAMSQLGLTAAHDPAQMFHGCNGEMLSRFCSEGLCLKLYDCATDFQPAPRSIRNPFPQLYLGDSVWMAISWALRCASKIYSGIYLFIL